MIGTHRLKCPCRFPPQQLRRIGRRRIRSIDVTGATWFDIVGYVPATRLFKRIDDFEDAASGACAQIDGKAFGTIEQSQRRDVSCGQVHDVNVVTDAGSVGGIVIISTYVKAGRGGQSRPGQQTGQGCWEPRLDLRQSGRFRGRQPG
jgi:hypothetical protein